MGGAAGRSPAPAALLYAFYADGRSGGDVSYGIAGIARRYS